MKENNSEEYRINVMTKLGLDKGVSFGLYKYVN